VREALARRSEPQPADVSDTVLRNYGIGAQILLDLGIRDLILLTNSRPHTLVALEGFGLNIVEERGFPGGA
jgi:3,4-dihydroxy 2-butanone 4-phosphate synthase/GTP cyclohydrolase II